LVGGASFSIWNPINIISDFTGANGAIGFVSIYLLFIIGTRVEDAIGRRAYIALIVSAFIIHYLSMALMTESGLFNSGGSATIAYTVFLFFTYLFPNCSLRGIWWFVIPRPYQFPVWMFAFVGGLIFTLFLFITGSRFSLVFSSISIAFILPLIFIAFLGGRKEILKKIGMGEETEEYPYGL
jgi:thiamine transporter ThiT